jgi:hypothetical protein
MCLTHNTHLRTLPKSPCSQNKRRSTYALLSNDTYKLTRARLWYSSSSDHVTANAQAVYHRNSWNMRCNPPKRCSTQHPCLAYVASAKLGDGKWKGSTAHAFVLHWQDQVRLFSDLVGNHKYFADNLLCTVLENAVTKLP